MVIDVDPIVISLGPLAIRWFGVLALLGLGVGSGLTLGVARASGIPNERVLDAAAWSIPVGVLSARALHVLSAWEYYFTKPAEIWQVTLGGLSLWGGLVGGSIAAALALRRDPLVRARIADAAAPGLALGIAIGQVGSFLNGDGQGVPADLPWGTRYTHELSAVPDFGVLRHPTQVYDGIVALLLFALLVLLPRTALPGLRFWTFLALYGGARVALGAVRLEPAFLFGLQLDQLVALLAVIFAVMQALGARRVARAAPRLALLDT
jgi:phosphatidylglycerol:prolipoprotein diacylglycerol transferase